MFSGNVRFIAFMANLAKSDFTDEDLKQFCKDVADNSERSI